jgi:hypothetical protein
VTSPQVRLIELKCVHKGLVTPVEFYELFGWLAPDVTRVIVNPVFANIKEEVGSIVAQ